MANSEENQSPLVDKIKAFIAKISEMTGLSEAIVGRSIFGAFLFLCAVIIYSRFANDTELQCDNIKAVSLVKTIIRDSNPWNIYPVLVDKFNLGKDTTNMQQVYDKAKTYITAESLTFKSIRTSSVNEKMKKTECAAQVDVKVQGVVPTTENIRYTLERTTDGKLFATVYGLR